jgi:hypothetical protein
MLLPLPFEGVYARVSAAKDWIDQTICSLSAYPPSSCFPQQVSQTAAPTRPPTRQPTPTPVPTPQAAITVQQQSVISKTSTPVTTYRIVVQYDQNPDQVKWFVRENRTRIVEYDYMSGVPPFGLVTVSLPLQSGHRYTLVLHDQGGDGFCCAQGPGKVDIIATVNGVDESLVSMLGDIGFYKMLKFTAP